MPFALRQNATLVGRFDAGGCLAGGIRAAKPLYHTCMFSRPTKYELLASFPFGKLEAGGQALISYLPVFPPALIQEAGDFMPCALFFELGDIALAVILAFWAAVIEVAAGVFFGRGRHIA